MAAVVTTTTIDRRTVWGDRRVHFAKLAFDAGDYADGGVAVTAAQFGLNVLETVLFQGAAFSATVALVPVWDPDAAKIVLFESAATGLPLLEKTAEAFPADVILRVIAIGY